MKLKLTSIFPQVYKADGGCQLNVLLPLIKGITKKEIALQLDSTYAMFNYASESGATSYHNYTRNELLTTCIMWDVCPASKYHLSRAGINVNLIASLH